MGTFEINFYQITILFHKWEHQRPFFKSHKSSFFMSTSDKIIHSCFYRLDIAVHKDDDILTVNAI